MSGTGQGRVDLQGEQLARDRIGIGVSARPDSRVADHRTGYAVDGDKKLVAGSRGIENRTRPHQREIVGVESVEGLLGKQCGSPPGRDLDAGDVIDIGSSGKACTGG